MMDLALSCFRTLRIVIMVRNVSIIILYDKDKKILLQHRAEDAKRLPGYWAFFGGGIEEGETPEQAVKREAFEELHYTLHSPKLLLKQKFNSKDDESEKYVYMEAYDPTKKIVLAEGQNLWWYHLSEIDTLKIIDHDREVLKYIEDKY